MEITSHERVMAALNYKIADRLPFSYGFGINEPVRQKLIEYLNFTSSAQLNTYLSAADDIRRVGPHCKITLPEGTDYWGVKRIPVSYGLGFYHEIVHYPLADVTDISELDDYNWADPDWFDYSVLPDIIKNINSTGNRYAIVSGTANIFETAWYMRGLENMLVDLITDPELAFEIMRRVTDFYCEYNKRILEAADGMVDIIFAADDIGTQTGLMMAIDTWRDLIKPHHTKINSMVHNHGVKVMYHTDGAVMDALEELVDMGIDILEALQFDAGDMNASEMKTRVGDKISFHGGISVQSTLPFGTPDDVISEVNERKRILGADGGYIIAPSHAVQAGTPPENVIAMIETAIKINRF